MSPRRAFGEAWEVSGMAPEGLERVPGWLMMAMGGVGQPIDDLSIRFPMCWAHVSIRAYVFLYSEALGSLWDNQGEPEQIRESPSRCQDNP